MPDHPDFKLDRIAHALDMSKSEVRVWIQESCCQAVVEVQLEGVPTGDFEIRGHRVAGQSLDDRTVARLVDRVLVDRPTPTFEELQSAYGLSADDTRLVCAKAISRKFTVSPLLLLRAFRMIEFCLQSAFVGGSRLDHDGTFVFRDGPAKEHAKAVMAQFRKSADKLRSLLEPLVDHHDPETGVPTLDPLLSRSSWIREIPRDAYEGLFRWSASGGLGNLADAIGSARTGSSREPAENVAVLIRWVWERAQLAPKTRHDGDESPYMQFAALVGRLHGVEIGLALLESTRDVEGLQGVPVFSVRP